MNLKRPLLLAAAIACMAPAWADVEWVRGQVVQIDAARSKITLKHAPIKMVQMEAMTMPFKVSDAAMLAPLKVGDRVRFEVRHRDGELLVLRIEPAK